jgi:dTMP kinase
MKSPLKQGLFITFEGIDGAGKTTLINAITRRLESEGYPVLYTKEPGSTWLGEQIRNLVLHSNGAIAPHAELCLYLTSRAQNVSEVIMPALKEHKIVLCDRYNDSTIAFQGAARGLGVEKVTDMCHFITQNLNPHLTLCLDIDPEVSLQRAKKNGAHDRIESEALSFHHKVRDAYRAIHKKNPKRFHLLDATQSPAKVFEDAIHLIEPFFH